jgi:hypothetical protein
MGLDRTFTIQCKCKKDNGLFDVLDRKAVEPIFDALNDCVGGFEGALYDGKCAIVYGVNWYDYEADMLHISKEFPDVLFLLSCAGATLDDTFEAGFYNGRVDTKCAVIPPLDFEYLFGGCDDGVSPHTSVADKCKDELSEELGRHYDLRDVAMYLEDCSAISPDGRCGTDAKVNKEALRLAAKYMNIYLDMVG